MRATLEHRIHADLRHRIARGQRPDLRLAALAAHYGSSTRPVRLALARLSAAGVLARAGARGWRIARRPRPGAAKAPPAADADARRLQDLLVRRALAGDESFLREGQACARLGLGRGRLRALLARFAGHGLVLHEPRRGWRVRALTQSGLDDFLRVRVALEQLALDLAFERLDDADLAAFAAGNAEHAPGDNRLHGYLIERAGNRYLSDFFARHSPYFELVFEWEGQDERAMAQTRRQHRAILRALRAGDRAAARAALAAHIADNHPLVRNLVRRR